MRQWYEFKNMHDETPELFIYDEIGESFWGEGVTAKNLVGYLNDLKSASKINVRINSPGGSVFDGNAIHNALVNHPADIHVHVDGMALSAASVIAMAGDTITMAENSMMMIHDPWAFVQGSADDMDAMSDVLGKIKRGIVESYHDKTGLGKRKVAAMMTDETWMTANEAVELGFADETAGELKVAACAMPDRFKNAPENFKDFFEALPQTATDEPKIVDTHTEETPTMDEPKDLTGTPEEAPQPEIKAQAELDQFKAQAEADVVAVIERAKALGAEFAVMAYELRDVGLCAIEIQSAIMDKHISSRSNATPPAEPAQTEPDQPTAEPEKDLTAEEAFNADSDKVASFGSFENYEAYQRMKADGRIRSARTTAN
tara:strand:+ start:902 stop:2020 length:1119 start_codon:yes stop_codon:yes gene_type:complete